MCWPPNEQRTLADESRTWRKVYHRKNSSSETLWETRQAASLQESGAATLRHLLSGAWLQPVPSRHLSFVPTDHRHRSEADAARGHSVEAQPPSLTLAALPRSHP